MSEAFFLKSDNSGTSATLNDSSASFVIKDEDYTIGNFLRFMLNRRADVEMVGCTVPHPDTSELNFRLQVQPKRTAIGVLNETLNEAKLYVNEVSSKIDQALSNSMS